MTVNHSKVEGLCLLASHVIEEGELITRMTAELYLVCPRTRAVCCALGAHAVMLLRLQISGDEYNNAPSWYWDMKTTMMELLAVSA